MRRLLLLALVLELAGPAGAQIVPTPGQPLDLAALVAQECGPGGYRKGASSCTLDFRKYPPGIYPLAKPAELGTCTNPTSTRNGLRIIGRGNAVGASVPLFPASSTTLECTTGVCISVCGSMVYLSDLVLEAYGADVGIRWHADNTHSAISHYGGLERVQVRGARTGVEVVGDGFNDQIDFLTFRDSQIVGADVGFVQDSQQAVNNTLENVEVTARQAGIVLRNGNLLVQGGYVGQWKQPDGTYSPTFKGFHGTRTSSTSASYMRRAGITMRDWHWEIHDGAFWWDDSGSSYPARLENVQFQHLPQSAEAAARLWSIYSDAPGALILDGVSFTSSTPAGVTASPRVCRKQGAPADVRTLNVTPWMGGLSWTCPSP